MADYSYMNTPKVKTAQQKPTTSTVQELGGQQRTLTTYDQPAAPKTTGTLQETPNPYAPKQSGGSNWSLPSWDPSTSQPSTYSTQAKPAVQGGGSQNFWDSANPWNGDYSNNHIGEINALLPVAQFDQNNYQYANDFNEAQRRWDAEFGLTNGQNQYQQQLSTRQQMSAEEQARLAASQWNQQFGHTQQMDMLGYGLSQQGLNNQYSLGMDQNQASRDVASTYANSNRYQADQQLAGQLGSAGLYSDAQRYQAQQQLAGQKYQANQQLAGQLGSANIYAGAQNYGADQQLAGQLGSAGMYSDAQRYQAQLAMQGQLGSAGIYSNAQMYGTDAQERMNQALMANNLAVANMQAYGRSQAPTAKWAANWG